MAAYPAVWRCWVARQTSTQHLRIAARLGTRGTTDAAERRDADGGAVASVAVVGAGALPQESSGMSKSSHSVIQLPQAAWMARKRSSATAGATDAAPTASH